MNTHITEATAYNPYDSARARAFELAAQIEQFQAYSPKDQEQIRQDVRAKLIAEAARGQVSHSALWRNAKAVYGIDPNELEMD
jgi:hypothetical protein